MHGAVKLEGAVTDTCRANSVAKRLANEATSDRDKEKVVGRLSCVDGGLDVILESANGKLFSSLSTRSQKDSDGRNTGRDALFPSSFVPEISLVRTIREKFEIRGCTTKG